MAENREIVRRSLEEPWGNPDVLDELVSDDYGHLFEAREHAAKMREGLEAEFGGILQAAFDGNAMETAVVAALDHRRSPSVARAVESAND